MRSVTRRGMRSPRRDLSINAAGRRREEYWLFAFGTQGAIACVHPVFKICFILFNFFLFFVVVVYHRENPHSPMNIFYLISSGLLDLDPLPALLHHEYLTRTQKKSFVLFIGGGGLRAGWRGRGGGGVDKNGWGRAWYYQTVLFISSFCKIRESRTQFYYFVPRLAAATVVTSRHQTAGNSTYHTQHPGTFSPPPTPTGRRYHLGSHVRVEVYEVSV